MADTAVIVSANDCQSVIPATPRGNTALVMLPTWSRNSLRRFRCAQRQISTRGWLKRLRRVPRAPLIRPSETTSKRLQRSGRRWRCGLSLGRTSLLVPSGLGRFAGDRSRELSLKTPGVHGRERDTRTAGRGRLRDENAAMTRKCDFEVTLLGTRTPIPKTSIKKFLNVKPSANSIADRSRTIVSRVLLSAYCGGPRWLHR